MNEINIVLVSLYRYQNFAVRILHPLLEKIDGVRVHTIFFKNLNANLTRMPTAREEELFLRLIAELNPELVGFSLLSPYAAVAKRLTKLAKDRSSALVIWGGIHPTISPETCLEHADMVCLGEGEGAMVDLARSLRDKTSYQSIKNLWIKDGARLIKNPLRPLAQDLDSLPFPAYNHPDYYFINANKLSRVDPLPGDVYFLQASRGCPYSCSYCVNSILHSLYDGLGPSVRRRSVDNIIKEMKASPAVSSGKVKHLLFADEVFATEESWLDEFGLKYKQEVGLPFCLEYNPQLARPQMVEKLAACGLELINFGIQSGSEETRSCVFNRPGQNSQILDLIEKIKGLGVRIRFDFMLDNPYDTPGSLKEYIEFLLKLPKPLSMNIYSLQHYPGYPLTLKALKDKYITQDCLSDERLMAGLRNFSYQPRFFPLGRRQALQNIIWLFGWNHTNERMVRLALKPSGPAAFLILNYLNLKSVILGWILADTGIAGKNSQIKAVLIGASLLLKADFKTFNLKLRNRLKIG